MPLESATNLRGALHTLSLNDPVWLARVDAMLGLVLSGTDSRRSMHGLYGWIDDEHEPSKLVRHAMRLAVGVLPSRFGRERRELVFAVHTALVVTAFFDEVRAALADTPHLRAPDARDWHQEDHSFVSYLYSDDVPAPSATRTFDAHLADITRWAADRAERVHRALLRVNPPTEIQALLEAGFPGKVASLYRAGYSVHTRLVPEFAVWSDVVEAKVARQALNRLSSELSPAVGPLKTLHTANQAALEEPLSDEAPLPTIGQGYIVPNYRATEAGPSARLADEKWWSTDVPPRQNMNRLLAAHLTSPLATRMPMLVIGAPGSGKSTLTKVLAAAPPTGNLAVVRVPLQSADPGTSVPEHIEQALRDLTGGTHTRTDLSGHLRVVVLDGVDDLRVRPDANYLSDVMRYQQNESSVGTPVAVVITSQMSLLDRVLIPDGMPVVKLEEFDDLQIRAWVDQWNRVSTRNGRRFLAPATALAHVGFARLPLGLAMLAAYLTDPAVPQASAELSTAALLGRLFDHLGTRGAANLIPSEEHLQPENGTVDPEPDSPLAGIEFVHRGLVFGTKPIGQLTWSSDGQLVAANSGGRLTFWKIPENASPQPLPSHPSASYVTWHPTRQIAAIVQRGTHSRSADEGTHNLVLTGPEAGEPRLVRAVRRGTRVSWSPDGATLALLDTRGLKVIDVTTGSVEKEYLYAGRPGTPSDYVPRPCWTRDGKHVLATFGGTVHLFRTSDLKPVWGVSSLGDVLEVFSPEGMRAIGAINFQTKTDIEIYDLTSSKVLAVLQGHTGQVVCVRFSSNGDFVASLSADNTVRIWRCRDWHCVATLPRNDIGRRGGLAFHPAEPLLAIKDGNQVDIVRLDYHRLDHVGPARTARRYANAKIVLVGDTGVGKSGLGLVLSGQRFTATESTHGRNVWTFEKSYATMPSGEVQTQETLLWDLAGQPGYRMIHQLHLNDVAVALVVFDARSETDPFAGVQYWSRALAQARRLDGAAAVRPRVYLVAARADRGTAAVSQDRIRATVRALGFDGYVETSAKAGWGVEELIRVIRDGIDWDALPVVSSNELFEAIKAFVVEEKKQGRILSTVDDLMHSFRRTQLDGPPIEELAGGFTACIGQLGSVGIVRHLSYGDFVLLQPELLDSYASSLVQAAKDEPDGLGFVREEDALEGRFRIPDDERLTNPHQERILLNAVVQELLRREIALKEVTDREVDLIFPSQFTRERPDAPVPPGQDVVFTFDGHLHSIYSTLAVRLTHSRFFTKDAMWQNCATYRAGAGGACGIVVREIEEGKGELALFYDEQAIPIVRRQFEAYVVEHLEQRATEVAVRRVRTCRACRYAIPDDLVRGRLGRGKTTITCPQCDTFEIALVDEPDEVADVRTAVEAMNTNANAQRDQDVDAVKLKGKRDEGAYDVFLCHNVNDKPQVLELAARLEARGILPWLDVHDIQPGSRWQDEMAKGIAASKTAAVLIGPAGRGSWREMEIQLIQDLALQNEKGVIPVILDGTEGDPDFPGFLRTRSAIDMRTPYPDPFEQLVWGITDKHPRLI